MEEIFQKIENIDLISSKLKDRLLDTETTFLFYPNDLKSKFFNLLPYSNCSEYNLSTDINCSNLIKKVFEKEVDDQTLVIYSNREHEKVNKIISNQKNTLKLDFHDINLLDLSKIQEVKKYKKVLVYIIGAHASSGEITPQGFFKKLINYFRKNSINYKIALDDCHGMFFTPRDYSIFDYIFGTAHAYIEGYNMGILISKEFIQGYNSLTMLNEYIDKIKILYSCPIQDIKQILCNYFSNYQDFPGFSICSTGPNIFCMKMLGYFFNEKEAELLKPFNINIEGINQYESYLRIRIPYLFKDFKGLDKGLRYFDNIVKNR